MTLKELRTKRADHWNLMKNFLDSHRDERGLLSATDDAHYANLEAEMQRFTDEIQRMERAEAIDAELNKAVGTPIVNQPMGGKAEPTGRASKEYRADFLNMIRNIPLVHNVMSEGTDANGGYLVPEEFERQIVKALTEQNVMRSICKVITTSVERKIPVANQHSTAAWTAEAAAYTEASPTFTQKSLDAYKLTDLVKVSNELIQDSMFDIESYIAEEFAYAFGVAEEEAFVIGNGSGKPTGVMTANGGGVGVTAAGTTAVTADEVISLVYSLKAPYRKNAKFLMNDDSVAKIRKLKDSTGQYLWSPGLQAGQPDRLLGYEVFTSAYAPTLAASAYALAFGDFSCYWIADRQGRTMQRLSELYSTNGQVGFIASQRVDGKIIDATGIKLLQMHA